MNVDTFTLFTQKVAYVELKSGAYTVLSVYMCACELVHVHPFASLKGPIFKLNFFFYL